MSVVEIQGSYLPRLGLEISITLFFPPKQHQTVIGCYLVNTARQSRGGNDSMQSEIRYCWSKNVIVCDNCFLQRGVTPGAWSLAPKAPAELQGQMVENFHPLEHAPRNSIS